MVLFLPIVLILVLGLALSLWSSEKPADDYDQGPYTGTGEQDPRSRWFF